METERPFLNAVKRLFSPQNSAAPNPTPSDSAIARAHSPYLAARDRKVDKEGMAELQPRVIKRPEPSQLANVPWPSPDQVRAFDAILAEEGYEKPAGLLEQLKALDEPFLRLQTAITECSKNQAGKYRDHLADLAKRTAEGDTTVHKEDAWSREEWESDARERMVAFKKEVEKIVARAWPIAEPALLAKAEFINEFCDRLEEKEQERFSMFAVPYRPPAYVLLLRKYAVSLSDGQRQHAGLPSAMIETL